MKASRHLTGKLVTPSHYRHYESSALQAGREIRIIVRLENLDDLTPVRLARDIRHKIQEGLQYPGQIKVTFISIIRTIN